MFLFIASASVFVASSLQAQNQANPTDSNRVDSMGKRQGVWKTDDISSYKSFFDRDTLIAYKIATYLNDKPIGVIRYFYPDHTVRWEGVLLNDNPEDEVDVNKPLHFYDPYGKEDYFEMNCFLGELFRIGRQYTRALSFAEKTYQLAQEQKDSLRTGQSLILLGRINYRLGHYQKAEQEIIRGRRIYAIVYGKKSREYSLATRTLSAVYLVLGDYSKAEKYQLEELDIIKNQPYLDSADYATALNNIGFLYDRKNEYEKAKSFFEQAVRLDSLLIDWDSRDFLIELDNLASAYARCGDYNKAIALHKKIIGKRKNLFGVTDSDYSESLNNLGLLYYKLGDLGKAESFLQDAVHIDSLQLGPMHPLYIISCGNLASIYKNLGKNERAEKKYLEIVNNIKNQIENFFPIMSEEEKFRFMETIQDKITRFNVFAFKRAAENPGILKDVLNLRLQTKALIFQIGKKIRYSVATSKEVSVQKLYRTWMTKRKHLTEMYTHNANGAMDKRIELLKDSIEIIEKDLGRFGDRTTYFEKFSWGDIISHLNKNDALIEMVRAYDSDDRTVRYVALVVTKDDPYPKAIFLPNGNEMESRYLGYYRNAINHKLEDVISFDNFWKPIDTFLRKQNITKVFFCADGVYHFINLNTLFNPTSKKYLLDEYDFELVSNPKDMGSDRIAHQLKTSTLIGAPDFSRFSEDTRRKENRLSDTLRIDVPTIPNTRIEIDSLSAWFQLNKIRTHVFQGIDASEENIKKIKSPDILHIATHGFFLSYKDFDEKGFANINLKSLKENQLLRSGVLLSGAKLSLNGIGKELGDDGVLTAYEAVDLSLENTELVTLSACDTGLGSLVNGEGVIGLQRSIQMAGAKSVMMSLWKVDDASTRSFMISFYTNLVKYINKEVALRKTQLELKEKLIYPVYWGAFVMIGR